MAPWNTSLSSKGLRESRIDGRMRESCYPIKRTRNLLFFDVRYGPTAVYVSQEEKQSKRKCFSDILPVGYNPKEVTQHHTNVFSVLYSYVTS